MRRLRMLVSMLLVFTMMLSVVPDSAYAKNKKSNKKISILDGKMLGPDDKQAGKPKPLKFKIDYENYDLKFTDVAKDDPHYKAVVWSVENGLIKNEQREIKLDEIMELREFFMLLFELRWKYHQRPEDNLSYYEYMVRNKILKNKMVLTTDMPEARSIITFGWYDSIFFNATAFSHEKTYPFNKYTYDPHRKVTNVLLYFLAGMPYHCDMAYFYRDFKKIVADDYYHREALIRDNIDDYYRSMVKSKKLNFNKKYFADMPRQLLTDLVILGLGFMQNWRLLKTDLTFDDLRLSEGVKRGDVLEMLFRMCKYVKDNDGNDFRVMKNWRDDRIDD